MQFLFFIVRVKVKECFKKKQKELLSSMVTLHIPSFGITVGPKSYIGSDRMLRTVADLWELPRIKTDKAKVVHMHTMMLCVCVCVWVPGNNWGSKFQTAVHVH